MTTLAEKILFRELRGFLRGPHWFEWSGARRKGSLDGRTGAEPVWGVESDWRGRFSTGATCR